MAPTKQGSTKFSRPVIGDNGGVYEIKIKGFLDDHWKQWFEGMTLKRVDDGEARQEFTLISGPLHDQLALHGLLARIRDLNLTLISVYRINSALNKNEHARVDVFPNEVAGKKDQIEMDSNLMKSEAIQDKLALLGFCGMYCGACSHYLASFPANAHLLDANRLGRKRAGFTCLGCRSDRLYLHPGCARCKIRPCARSKGLLHCGLCEQFPCDQLLYLQNDGRSDHRQIIAELRRLLDEDLDKWLKDQQQRWKCECGASFSWYEEYCVRCGSQLRPSPRPRDL